MNNPMQSNFMRSPSGPPIAKKQRGGATPGSIRARPRGGPPLRVGASSSSASGIPPPTVRGPPPSASSSASSPVDDAIARRRAELRRLQEKARGTRAAANSVTNSTKASAQSKAPPAGPPAGPPPIPPLAAVGASKRSSDIFPGVHPKSPSVPKQALSLDVANSKPVANTSSKPSSEPESEKPTIAQAGPPTSKPAANTNTNPNLPPETPLAGAIPPTPAVGRRLEFPSGKKPPTDAKTDAKPPPTTNTTTRRARSKSPTPTKSLAEDTKSKAAKALAARRNRAKSAPPRRPPGPPPAGPKPGVTKTKTTQARRPPPMTPASLVQKDTTTNINNSKPSTTTIPDDTKTVEDVNKDTAGSPVGTGSMDTSAIPSGAIETPKVQKPSIADGLVSGSATPPSSGSSARRQKLQLMQKQAAAASSLPPTLASSTTGTTPATPAFAAAAVGGPPATDAFAKAIGATTAPPVPDLVPVQEKSTAPPHSAALSRLEDAYQKSEREKTAALVKIKQLEDQLSQKAKEGLQQARINRAGGSNNNRGGSLDVNHLLFLEKTQGPEAALSWAKSLPKDGPPSSPARPPSQMGYNTGFGVNNTTPVKSTIGGGSVMTPAAGVAFESPLRRARIATRTLTPHLAKPQTNMQASGPHDDESPEQTERRLLRSFREAAQYVPFEFSSELATYTVRRPYGIHTNPGLFDHCRPPTEDPNAYAKRAHVSDKTSIEVAAVVKADNTPVLVFGHAGIRYQTDPNDLWKHVENVDDLDRPLGHVTYIDRLANEREYSMDELLEEALLVREQYCGTLTSTALGLENRPPVSEVRAAGGSQPDLQKAPSKDVGVGTEEKAVGGGPPPGQNEEQQQRPPTHTHTQPPIEKDEGGSSDILIVFLGMVLSFFFNLVWGVFIGTPLRIIRTVFVVTIACFILQALHFYIADDYNTWALREMGGGGALSASDLAYFSNRQPGIL